MATQTQLLSAAQRRSFTNDIGDREKYPYLVGLVNETEYRQCIGTLITSNWVLTAAQCFSSSSHVRYGDLRESGTHQKRKIVNMIHPPASYIMIPDIGLLYIDNIPMKKYARLSAVDYKTLQGLPVEFAGLRSPFVDRTINNDFKHERIQQLEVGKGLAIACEKREYTFTPYICMAPKCSDFHRLQLEPGEAGEPLFFAGKVVAVHAGSLQNHSIRHYTPISPYLSWISSTMTAPPYQINFRSSNISALDKPGDRVLYQKFHNISRYLYGLKFRLKAYREKVQTALLNQLP